MLKRPIRRLLSTNSAGGSVSVQVSVVPMTSDLIRLWMQKVQPLINANYQHSGPAVSNARMIRADVGWNWGTNLWLAKGHSVSAPARGSGPAVAMCLVVHPQRAPAFPIGMLTAVPLFNCAVHAVSRPRGFAWYLADAPKEAYQQVLKTNAVKGVAGALVDCSIQATGDVGSDMMHLLHADPNGGNKLESFYIKCGMVQLPANHGPITPLLRRSRPQEYFHFDHAGALGYSQGYDVLR